MQIITLLPDALKEIDILKKINHKNVVNLKEIIENDETEKIYLIMEYAKKGSLMSYNEKTKQFFINKNYSKENVDNYSEEDLRRIVKDLASGLSYLHNVGIIHRDLKPENILIDEENCCKISDFNVSSVIINGEDKFTKTEGTICFYAPECCKGKSESFAGKPIDVWALGVCLYISTFKVLPFASKDNNMYEIISQINAFETLKLPSTREISAGLTDLLNKIFNKDPEKRITAEQILQHPWILEQTTKIQEKEEKSVHKEDKCSQKEEKEKSFFACVGTNNKKLTEKQAKEKSANIINLNGNKEVNSANQTIPINSSISSSKSGQKPSNTINVKKIK